MSKSTQAVLIKYSIRLVIIFAGVSCVLFFIQSINNYYKFNEIDFTSYIRASQNFWDGQNPYIVTPRRYSYPLFLAVVLYPLTWFQSGQILRGLSIGLWSLGAYMAFFATIMATLKIPANNGIGELSREIKLAMAAMMVVLLHPFLQSEFINGQINLFILGAAAGYFLMLERDHQLWAALFLAFAASIKIGPGICLLCVFFTGQYRTIWYFIGLFLIINIGLPYLVNDRSFVYYDYYLTVVLADAAEHDFLAGWRSFSIISTLSYIFDIHWNPMAKMTAIMGLAIALAMPLYLIMRRRFHQAGSATRLHIFAALISIIPLAFPISEPHHLLILTIPYALIVHYWYSQLKMGENIMKDRLSILFFAVVAGLQIGHGLKDAPIRLCCLVALYIGMLYLVKTTMLRRPT